MEKEESDFYDWMYQTINKYRGEFANRAIIIEQLIETFIAQFFIAPGDNRYGAFVELMLNNQDMTFNRKIEMFTRIIAKFLPELNNKYQSDIKKITNLRQIRNKFAHYAINGTPEILTKNKLKRNKIFLTTIEDFTLKHVTYELKTLDVMAFEFADLTEKLNNLLNEFRLKSSSPT